MPLSTTRAEYDLAIVGGGLVGASLPALSLAPLGLRIALVEAVSPVQGEQHPSFDERTTALANGTVRAFRTLGVWAGMEREAAPIRRIDVSDQGRFGSARIDAAEQGLEALGYVVPNRAIGAALWQGLSRAPVVEVIAPARVTGSEVADGRPGVAHYEVAGQAHSLRARLVVAADGIRSLVRDQAGIEADHIGYEQVAITAVMTTQRFHDYVAYERFTAEGPIAILPLTDGRCGMVWTRKPAEVERMLALSDDEFLREFQAAFGFRLGRWRFLRIGQRASYNLMPLAGRPPHCATTRRRRQCGAGPASNRRAGVQPGIARRDEPRRSHRRPARGRHNGSRRCEPAAGALPTGARAIAVASSPSPMASCACSRRRWEHCGACAASASSPSTCCRPPSPRSRA